MDLPSSPGIWDISEWANLKKTNGCQELSFVISHSDGQGSFVQKNFYINPFSYASANACVLLFTCSLL